MNSGVITVCSPVFCSDQLLDLVQQSGIFNDSKEFVDRPLLEPSDVVLERVFRAYKVGGVRALGQEILDLTSLPGSDLLEWEPPDWTPRYSHL